MFLKPQYKRLYCWGLGHGLSTRFHLLRRCSVNVMAICLLGSGLLQTNVAPNLKQICVHTSTYASGYSFSILSQIQAWFFAMQPQSDSLCDCHVTIGRHSTQFWCWHYSDYKHWRQKWVSCGEALTVAVISSPWHSEIFERKSVSVKSFTSPSHHFWLRASIHTHLNTRSSHCSTKSHN